MKKRLILLSSVAVATMLTSCSDSTDEEKKPKITILGKNPDTISLNISYHDSGATALNHDGTDLTSAIKKSGFIDSSMAGSYNIQYTVANSEGISDTANRTVVVRDIYLDTVLSADIKLMDKTVIYRITQSATVAGNVTIGEGVQVVFPTDVTLELSKGVLSIGAGAKISFGEEAFIALSDGGKIEAKGALGNEILFTNFDTDKYWGDDNASDYAGGIWIGTTAATGNILDFVIFNRATTGVMATRKNGLTITNSQFKDCKYYGIHYSGVEASATNSANGALGSTSFSGSLLGDILADASNLIYFKNDITQEKGIVVDGGKAIEAGTWPSLLYIIDETVIIQKSLITIEAGATFKFKEDKHISVEDEGSINIAGTATKRITFENKEVDKYWGDDNATDYAGGIWISETAATGNTINYATFKRATTGVMATRKNGITITNSEFKDCKYYGIHYFGSEASTTNSANGALGSTSFSGCLLGDILANASNLIYFKNDITQDKGIVVNGGNALEAGTWPSLLYIIDESVTIQKNLITIEAGAILKFKEDKHLGVEAEGSIHVAGTATSKVILENKEVGKYWGDDNAPDYSGGIWISESAATTSIIENSLFRRPVAAIYVDNNIVTVKNTVSEDAKYYDIRIAGSKASVNLNGTDYTVPQDSSAINVSFQ